MNLIQILKSDISHQRLPIPHRHSVDSLTRFNRLFYTAYVDCMISYEKIFFFILCCCILITKSTHVLIACIYNDLYYTSLKCSKNRVPKVLFLYCISILSCVARTFYRSNFITIINQLKKV